MAEVVQFHLEGMVPELEEYIKLGVFTKEEVRSIVKRRTNFEYLIKKRNPSCQDFLRYAQYEMNLDLLAKKRRTRVPKKLLANAMTSKFAAKRRINFIFQRALRKFAENVGLWLVFIDWESKIGSTKALSATFAKAVQLHPDKPIFWSKAAQYEYESNGNVEAARILLQRGLRIIPTSELLWLSLFRLEIAYLEKLKERTRVLGFMKKKPCTNVITSELNSFSNGDDEIKFQEKDMETNYDAELLGGMLADKDEFFSGLLAATVFKNAILKVDGITFRNKCFNLIPKLSVYSSLREMIDSSILNDFKQTCECWQVLADHAVLANQNMNKELVKISVFEQGVLVNDSADFILFYAKYLQGLIATIDMDDLKAENSLDYYGKLLLNLVRKAELACHMNEELVEISALTYLRFGEIVAAENVLNKGCAEFPNSFSIIQLKMKFITNQCALKSDFSRFEEEVAKFETFVYSKIPQSSCLLEELVDFYLQIPLFAEDKENARRKVVQVFQKILVRLSSVENNSYHDSFRCMYLQYCFSVQGLSGYRRGTDYLLSLPNKSFSVLKSIIDFEAIQPKTFYNASRLYTLYEHLVNTFGADTFTWLSYIEFVMEQDSSKVQNIYSRAMKSVKNTAEFMEHYQTMK